MARWKPALVGPGIPRHRSATCARTSTSGGPSRLENRERIERRSRALLDAERRGHEQELVAIQPSRLFDGSLDIEVVEDADTHSHERQLMKPHALR